MATVEDRVSRMERQVRGMDQEMQSLAGVVAASTPASVSAEPDEFTGAATSDQIWSCRKCSARLGFYDPSTEELRMRYKDFVVYATIGVGGSVRVLCRSCSEINKADWTPKSDSPENRV